MRFLFILIVLVIGNQAEAKERRWQCIGKDDKELIRLDKTLPCPVGFRAYELDSQDNIILNGYDPLASQKFVRCTGINKVVFYKKEEFLMQKALGGVKEQPVEVNREGFTPEEAKIDTKRRENLAKQKEWEQGKNVNRPLTGGVRVEGQITTKQHDNCQSWKNSNIIDPTPEKKKYIKDNC